MKRMAPTPIEYASEPPGSTLQRADSPEGFRLVEPPPGTWQYLKWVLLLEGASAATAIVIVTLVTWWYSSPDPVFAVRMLATVGLPAFVVPGILLGAICWLLGWLRVEIDITPAEVHVTRGLGRGVRQTLARNAIAAVRRRFHRVQFLDAKGRMLLTITFNRLANAKSAEIQLRQ